MEELVTLTVDVFRSLHPGVKLAPTKRSIEELRALPSVESTHRLCRWGQLEGGDYAWVPGPFVVAVRATAKGMRINRAERNRRKRSEKREAATVRRIDAVSDAKKSDIRNAYDALRAGHITRSQARLLGVVGKVLFAKQRRSA